MGARLNADIPAPRLLLRLIGRAAVQDCLAGRLEAAGRRLGARMPPEVAGHLSGLSFSRGALDADPAYAPWSSRALVLRDENVVAGLLRFHARPAPHPLADPATVAAELGYAVFAPWRRRGLAREAALAAMDWATAMAGVRRFIVSVAPDNLASLALARSLGFTRVGEQIDAVDGLELVLLRNAGG